MQQRARATASAAPKWIARSRALVMRYTFHRSGSLARCLRCKKAGPELLCELAACKTLASRFGRVRTPLAPNSWSSASKNRPCQDDGQVATRLYRARAGPPSTVRVRTTLQQARVQKTPKLSGSSTPVRLSNPATPLKKNSRVKTPTDDCCHSSRPVGPPNKENRRFYLKTGV